jgi:tetratricopeptide (TPR) repeat protein
LQARPDDYFVIYIAAHGVIAQTRGAGGGPTEEVPYFVLYDTDPKDIAGTGLRMESYKQLVAKVPAKKGLVLSDTCHSAGVLLAGRGLYATTRANSRYLEEMQKFQGGVGFLSAADQTESSYERDDLGHGVFTHCFLEGVRGNADTDADGKVTFEELKNYVRDEVPKLTNNKQHPQYNTTTLGANQIPLSVVSYPEVGKCGAGSPCGTLRITNPEVDGVTVAIDNTPVGAISTGGQRTIRVPVGVRQLIVTKGALKQSQAAEIAPGRTTTYEINAAFTQSDAESLVDTSAKQKQVYLTDERTPSKQAEETFQRGVDSFNKQRFKEAIALFNDAIKLNGGAYSQAFTYRGRAEQSLGLKEDAINSFQAALATRPSDYQTRTLLAEAKFNAGRNTEEIVTELRSIIKRYPIYDFAYVVLGDVLFARRDMVGAERTLRKAIALNPKFPPARMILANVLMYKDPKAKFVEQGNLIPAEPLKEAVTQAEEAHRLFNEIAKKKVSVAKGVKHLSISHLIFGGARYADDPAMAEANYILGKAYTRWVGLDEEGKLTDAQREQYLSRARPHLQEALRLAQSAGDKLRQTLVLLTSADNYFLAGDSEKAIKDGEAALKLAESLPNVELTETRFEAHTILFQAYASTQDFPKAAAHLRRGLDLYGARLSADERARLNDMLRDFEDRSRANRKK